LGFSYNSSLCALIKILESDKKLSAVDDISTSKFREKTGNERFIDESMETVIIKKVRDYLNG